MTALIVILSIIAFIAVLLSLSVSFHISYNGDYYVRLFYGPLNFQIYPKRTVKKVKKSSNGKKVKSKQVRKDSDKEDHRDFFETVSIVIDTIKAIVRPVERVLKKIRITKLDVQVIVASDDAAKTAEDYGKMCGIVYGGVVALKNVIRIKVKNLNVGYDFNKEETAYRIAFRIKLKTGYAIIIGLSMIKNILVNNFKKGKTQTPIANKSA